MLLESQADLALPIAGKALALQCQNYKQTYTSTYSQTVVLYMCSSAAMNSPLCEEIVLRIPESRWKDYSSILHTRIDGTYQTTIWVWKTVFRCLFLTEPMHKVSNNMWQSYMTSTWQRSFINFIPVNFLRNFRTIFLQ